MTEIWSILIPILLTDVVNPVLFAFMVYAVGSERPLVNSGSMLLGHTAAYFTGGIVLAMGLESITDRLLNPHRMDYFISLVAGLLLLGVAYKLARSTGRKEPDQAKGLTPLSAFGTGAVINFVGLPFAIPYFAAISQILKLEVPVVESLSLLAGYNLIYMAPFLVIPGLYLLIGERSKPILEEINNVLDRIANVLLPLLLGLIGLALVADAVYFFMTGEGLIQF